MSVIWSVGHNFSKKQSGATTEKAGKLHFHASIGALVYFGREINEMNAIEHMARPRDPLGTKS